MTTTLKRFLIPFIPHWVRQLVGNYRLRKWQKAGCPIPPPHFAKQLMIQEFQKKHNCSVLIETGTYMGDMVEAQKRNFRKVYSIELSQELFEAAKKRFRKDDNVQIVQGDSGKVLSSIVKELNEPAVFWLDGHYSAGVTAKGEKECPIYEELDAIFSGKKLQHVILIDDARCFVGQNDYPTMNELKENIQRKVNRFEFSVEHDIIRIVLV
jgi:hypothetical protein